MRYLYPFHLFNAKRSHSYIQYQVHCSGSYRFSKVRHGWWRGSNLVQMGFACGIVFQKFVMDGGEDLILCRWGSHAGSLAGRPDRGTTGGGQRLCAALSSLAGLLECTLSGFASLFGFFELECGFLVFGLEGGDLGFGVFEGESHVLHLGVHFLESIVSLLGCLALVVQSEFNLLDTFVGLAGLL